MENMKMIYVSTNYHLLDQFHFQSNYLLLPIKKYNNINFKITFNMKMEFIFTTINMIV